MKIGVLGGGAWGTALGAHAVRAGHEVRLWVRASERAAAINDRHQSPTYLPGVSLPEGLRAETDPSRVLTGAALVLVVIPSAHFREVCRPLAAIWPKDAVGVSATKGIEIGTGRRMTEIAREELPGEGFAALSGPSFALEVAKGLPTAVVVASEDLAAAERVQRALATRTFRVYSSDDVVGVELGGALKNVIAIAAGIVDGLGYGHNTVAALITRGLVEITRLAVALVGRPDTLAGLAGLGDLRLNCTAALSLERHVGQAAGGGRTPAEGTGSPRAGGGANPNPARGAAAGGGN